MSDDWRLRIHLPGDVQGKTVAESLEATTVERELEDALSDRIAVSHDDDDVFVYGATREDVEAARDLVGTLAAEKGWQVEPTVARWHPVAEEWEDPDKPLPTGADEVAAERAELIEQEREESQTQGYPDFEVRVHCGSRHEAVRLQERLSSEGIPSVRRWHYLLIGATDEDSANALAERIKAESPPGTEVRAEGSGRAADAAKPSNPFAIFGGLGG
jgi:hypothetical protein